MRKKLLFILIVLTVFLAVEKIYSQFNIPAYTQLNNIVEEKDDRYVVVKGDTLASIASKNNINLYALAGVNKIKDINRIDVGTKLDIRGLNKSDVHYIINILTERFISEPQLRNKVSDVIFNNSTKENIDPMIVMGIFGIESSFNPYVTALYIDIPKKSNIPKRFSKLQDKIVVAYDCQHPSRVRPDIGAMQISYYSATGTLNLSSFDLCRLNYDAIFNIEQAIKLLSIKRDEGKRKFKNRWHLTYHNRDYRLMNEYEKDMNKIFYKIYKLLLEKE